MRTSFVVAMSLLAGSLVAAPTARADDPAPAGKAPAEAPKASGGDAAKKDEPTLRVERAKKLVKELEDAVVRIKAAQPIDAQLLQQVMEMLDQAKTLAKAATPPELTPEEKKAVVDEAKKQQGPDAAKAPDPMTDWQEKQLAKALDGADLNEEESLKAKQIIGDWFKENMAAMGDSKKVSDLKRKRNDDLDKALGKKAQKVINNLNSMGPGRGK